MDSFTAGVIDGIFRSGLDNLYCALSIHAGRSVLLNTVRVLHEATVFKSDFSVVVCRKVVRSMWPADAAKRGIVSMFT